MHLNSNIPILYQKSVGGSPSVEASQRQAQHNPILRRARISWRVTAKKIAMPIFAGAFACFLPNFVQAAPPHFSQNTANVILPSTAPSATYLIGAPIDAVPKITLPKGTWLIQAKVNPVSFNQTAIQVSCSAYIEPPNSTPATIQPLDTSATVVGGVNSGAPVTAVISNMGVASISTAGATLELQCQILSYTAGLTILPTGVYLTGASWLVATPISK